MPLACNEFLKCCKVLNYTVFNSSVENMHYKHKARHISIEQRPMKLPSNETLITNTSRTILDMYPCPVSRCFSRADFTCLAEWNCQIIRYVYDQFYDVFWIVFQTGCTSLYFL